MNAPAYYAFRPEIARAIPQSARTIVDVGCGDGSLGRGLKQARADLAVYGIEIDAAAAAQARAHLDGVSCAGADDPLPAQWPAPDCVVFADVLEHLVDPWACLARWRERIPEGAAVIVSLPNVAHYSAVMPLLRGRWDYRSAGTLDRTHLRFFTRDTGVEMLRDAGFRVERCERLWGLPKGVWRYPGKVLRRLDRRRGVLPSPGAHFADLYTLQYVYVAR